MAGLYFDDIRVVKVILPLFEMQNRYSEIIAMFEEQRPMITKGATPSEDLFMTFFQKAS